MQKFLFILLSTISISATAQVKVALTGGINLNSISWKDKDNANVNSDSADYTYTSTKGKQGFNIGLLVDFHTEENWYIETGVLYTKKGGRTDETTTLTPGNVSFKRTQYFSPSYIQLPLYLLYMSENKNKYKLTAGAGLLMGFGVGGKYESNTNINNGPTIKLSRDTKFGIVLTDDFAKMEFGYGTKVGFLMNDNISFNLSFQRSFVNNAPKVKEQNGSIIHNTIGLTLTKYIKR